MPQAPQLPPGLTGATPQVDPMNFLLAAAEAHQSGALPSDVPTGQPLQTGKAPRRKIRVIK